MKVPSWTINAPLKTMISPGHELCTAQPLNAAREHTVREYTASELHKLISLSM